MTFLSIRDCPKCGHFMTVVEQGGRRSTNCSTDTGGCGVQMVEDLEPGTRPIIDPAWGLKTPRDPRRDWRDSAADS